MMSKTQQKFKQRDAARFGISVRTLNLRFETLGQSFGRWLLENRLDACGKALRDLRQQSSSISEIAYRWGFNDLSHFNKAFRASFGMNPLGNASRVQQVASIDRTLINLSSEGSTSLPSFASSGTVELDQQAEFTSGAKRTCRVPRRMSAYASKAPAAPTTLPTSERWIVAIESERLRTSSLPGRDVEP